MKRVDISHPAINEMISRRSDGDPSYVAGVRAFLTEGGKPPEGTIAYKGYLDAHDMTAYLSGILADLRADEWVEESRVFRRRFVGLENPRPAPQTPRRAPATCSAGQNEAKSDHEDLMIVLFFFRLRLRAGDPVARQKTGAATPLPSWISVVREFAGEHPQRFVQGQPFGDASNRPGRVTATRPADMTHVAISSAAQMLLQLCGARSYVEQVINVAGCTVAVAPHK